MEITILAALIILVALIGMHYDNKKYKKEQDEKRKNKA